MASLTRMPVGCGFGPEFQILWPVIVSYAVAVVNGLRWQQVTA